MYIPSDEILRKYADVMVNFALRNGKWIKEWDVVFVYIPECAKPFLIPLQEVILKAWWHPIYRYLPDWIGKSFYENASMDQLEFIPKAYREWEIESKTHALSIIAETDLHELDGIDPAKIMTRIKANRPYRELTNKKERDWKFSWTVCMYWTPAMAKEANLSEEEYRDQIVKACFLDEENPVKKWKEINAMIQQKRDTLNDMKIQYVHVVWPDEDLKVKIWSDRAWAAGSGCNIPSFEIFTSPDCREVDGWVRFNQPLYRYGNLIEWIELEFKDWFVTNAHAKKNDNILQDMIKIDGMKQIWEFSLTDARTSKITKFMAETLFDENVGWEFGNTHIALGMWFDECFNWDKMKLDDPEFKKSIWLNSSAEHVDIISTANRTVTATLENWTEKIIYENWMFTI